MLRYIIMSKIDIITKEDKRDYRTDIKDYLDDKRE